MRVPRPARPLALLLLSFGSVTLAPAARAQQQEGGAPTGATPPTAASSTAAAAAATGAAAQADAGGAFAPGLPLDLRTTGPITLTVEQAVAIARAQSIALRAARLDAATTEAQVREARSGLLPSVALASSYTRNVVQANPFAGSSAGGLFSSLAFVDWLAYNERARTDADDGTNPITFPAYADSVNAGYQRAGVSLDGSDNPFGVANQFQNAVSVQQNLYNRSALIALRGARRLTEVQRQALVRQEQTTVDGARRAFYTVLLADAQVEVVRASVARARATENEAARRVEAGAAPRLLRLTAEVQRANLESQLVTAANAAALALENLKVTLGVPAEVAVRLDGSLEAAAAAAPLAGDAPSLLRTALDRRPEVAQARVGVELARINRELTRSAYFPSVGAFVNFGLSGSVPDNRNGVVSDPDAGPFAFRQTSTGFFSDAYWQPSVAAGVRLNWSLFDGGRTRAQVQQRRIAEEQAALTVARTEQAVRLDVQRALLNVEAAGTRLATQAQTVARAEESYRVADQRLGEGVTTALEVREASAQLDQSRLGYLQALFDLVTARSALDTALGTPVPPLGAAPVLPQN